MSFHCLAVGDMKEVKMRLNVCVCHSVIIRYTYVCYLSFHFFSLFSTRYWIGYYGWSDHITSFHTLSVKPFSSGMKNPFFVLLYRLMVVFLLFPLHSFRYYAYAHIGTFLVKFLLLSIKSVLIVKSKRKGKWCMEYVCICVYVASLFLAS